MNGARRLLTCEKDGRRVRLWWWLSARREGTSTRTVTTCHVRNTSLHAMYHGFISRTFNQQNANSASSEPYTDQISSVIMKKYTTTSSRSQRLQKIHPHSVFTVYSFECYLVLVFVYWVLLIFTELPRTLGSLIGPRDLLFTFYESYCLLDLL